MLTHYSGYPAFDLLYDRGGHAIDANVEREASDYFLTGPGKDITDIILISHGWNNDENDARTTLYNPFFGQFATTTPKFAQLKNRTFGVLAIFWPSKRFADADLIPGGTASFTGNEDALLSLQLDRLTEIFVGDPNAPTTIAQARTLIPKLESSPSAQNDFVALLLSLAPKSRYEIDEGLDAAFDAMSRQNGSDILARLGRPFAPVVADPGLQFGSGSAAGLAFGTGTASGWLGTAIGGIKNAASSLANLITYYTMKDRAGIVGRTGVAEFAQSLLDAIAKGDATRRVHLIGHSFGGRLVTSAVNSLRPETPVTTMVLLQAAYSHNGLSADYGGGKPGSFRAVVAERKAQSLLITHSKNDIAVGVAYPLASRAMNQTADALIGGPNDLFGGMGRNGAQHTAEARFDDLLPVGSTPGYPAFADGTWIRNLNGDGDSGKPRIGSHGDVAKPEITWAFGEHLTSS